MTMEELQAELAELKQGNEALANKNKELLGELKTERKTNRDSDVDSEKYYKLKDEFDELKESKAKLEHEVKTRDKDIAKLTESNNGLNTNLQSVLIDGGLSDSLAKIGVKAEFMDATRALLRDKVSIVDNQAVVDDKPLADYMTEWANDGGKHFIKASDNGGSGSNGGQGGNGSSTKGDLSGSKAEQEAYIKEKFNIA